MQQVENTIQSSITPKAVVKYAVLPGILPRILRLAEAAARFFFIFTQIFGAIGLIGRNHPCLRAENIGRYRFVDVVGLAAGNVVFDKKHLPQTIMFFVIIFSIVLTICMTLAMLASSLLYAGEAHAQFFGTPTELQYDKNADWAFRFLYRIFGKTSFFGEPQAGSGVGNPWFTTILVGMLRYYSLAMLVIAAFMILYIMVTTLTEAAQSGKPFGSRFDSIWAPIRLALAIGLLIPISGPGYNGAQLIVFQSAVWGSNLATNTWYGGLKAMKDKGGDLFATSMGDQGYRFLRDIFLVNLCVESYPQLYKGLANTVLYHANAIDGVITYSFGPLLSPGFCGVVTVLGLPSVNSGLSKPADLVGESWPEKTIKAYQEITKIFLPIPPDQQLTGSGLSSTGLTVLTVLSPAAGYGASRIQGLALGKAIVHQPMSDIVTPVTKEMMKEHSGQEVFSDVVTDADKMSPQPASAGSSAVMSWITQYRRLLGSESKVNSDNQEYYSPFFSEGSKTDPSSFPGVIQAYNNWMYASLTQDARYGWTTAGVFYLRMASAMSTISRVVNNPPKITELPVNMEKAYATEDEPSANSDVIASKCSGFLNAVKNIANYLLFQPSECQKYKNALRMNAFLRGGQNWFEQSVSGDPAMHAKVGGRERFNRSLVISEPESSANLDAGMVLQPVLDSAKDMAEISSTDMNPLGAVISWGNALMTMALIAFGISIVGLGEGVSSIASTLGFTLMLPGFILAFYVPMIPFLHFTFAVIEWMISILEAVVAMPLWALSLITLEGDGLGANGMKGVSRLFEIILRPTIIVLALIMSIILFGAGVAFFNDAMSLYAHAYTSGTNNGFFGAAVAGLGMIFIYMFGIYTLATASFKLIDIIPDKFGRWMGLEDGLGSMMKLGHVEGIEGVIAAGATYSAGKQISGGVGKVRQGNAQAQKDKADKLRRDEKKAKKAARKAAKARRTTP